MCFNNFRTLDKNKEKINFYKIPKNKEIQRQYATLLKTGGANMDRGHICCEHWIDCVRKDSNHLPEIIVPQTQIAKLNKKINIAAKNLKRNPDSTSSKLTLKTLKKKLIAATNANKRNVTVHKARRKVVKHSLKKRQKPDVPVVDVPSTSDMSKNSEIEELKQQLKAKSEEVLHIQNKLLHTEGQLLYTQQQLLIFKNLYFSFKSIAEDRKIFKYLCGLDLDQFNILMDIVKPYLSLLNHTVKNFSYETQYLAILTISRHGLDYRFMAFILRTSEATVGRIANSWFIFLATLFNEIDLMPEHGFLIEQMPSSFVTTGHGKTDLVIDATEFKFNFASNLDVNTLLFSHYKNHSTGKALIGIAPHGMGIMFSEVYPGSISDSEITEKTNTIHYVNEAHEIMSDRGFSIQDLCSAKGITLNRPKQKENPQFNETEVQRNFDIASTRIHVERFIGRVRDWKILNNTWPLVQIDMLTCVWQMLCHTVNLTCPPIGPKEE